MNRPYIKGSTLLLALLTACLPSDSAPEKIRGLLDRQVEDWNRGDVEAFMEGYWKSDQMIFKSGDDEQRGWEAALKRYQTAYDTREKMGRLSFSELAIEEQGPDDARVTGRWLVARAPRDLSGRFTLWLRRLPEGWRIVRDETTSD